MSNAKVYPLQNSEDGSSSNDFSNGETHVNGCVPFKRIKPSGEPLTIEKLRSFKGCENYTDSEAAIIVESISELAGIIVRACLRAPMLSSETSQLTSAESISKQSKKAA